MVAAKYGIMAIVGPVLLMVIVNFVRAKLCQSSSNVMETEATRVNVELAWLGTDSSRAVTAANAVIADDTDDDDDGDAHGGGGGGGNHANGVRDDAGGRSKPATNCRSRNGAAAAPAAGKSPRGSTGIASDSDSSSSSPTVDPDDLATAGDGAGDSFFSTYGNGRLSNDDDSSSDLPEPHGFSVGEGDDDDDNDNDDDDRYR